jgi:hypothetical protein
LTAPAGALRINDAGATPAATFFVLHKSFSNGLWRRCTACAARAYFDPFRMMRLSLWVLVW